MSLLLLVSAQTPEPPPTTEISRIVVLPFAVTGGLDQKKSSLLDEVMLTELGKVVPKQVALLGSSDLVALLGYEQQKQLAGCGETSCMVEIGNAMGASHIIVLSLGKLGSQFLITEKLVDVGNAKVVQRSVLNADDTEDALLAGVRQTAKKIGEDVGWLSSSTTATTSKVPQVDAVERASDPNETEPATHSNLLFWVGAGTAAVGALAAIGLGIGATAMDATTVGDANLAASKRQEAAQTVTWLSGGSLLGLVTATTGAVLLVVSLM